MTLVVTVIHLVTTMIPHNYNASYIANELSLVNLEILSKFLFKYNNLKTESYHH